MLAMLAVCGAICWSGAFQERVVCSAVLPLEWNRVSLSSWIAIPKFSGHPEVARTRVISIHSINPIKRGQRYSVIPPVSARDKNVVPCGYMARHQDIIAGRTTADDKMSGHLDKDRRLSSVVLEVDYGLGGLFRSVIFSWPRRTPNALNHVRPLKVAVGGLGDVGLSLRMMSGAPSERGSYDNYYKVSDSKVVLPLCIVCRIFGAQRGPKLLAQLYIAILLYATGLGLISWGCYYSEGREKLIAFNLAGGILFFAGPALSWWCAN